MTDYEYTRFSDDFNSEVVDQIFYNANTQVLTLDLNDTVYQYEGVDHATADGIFSAKSKGTYFRDYIRNRYATECVGNWWNINNFNEVETDVVEDPTYHSLRTEKVGASLERGLADAAAGRVSAVAWGDEPDYEKSVSAETSKFTFVVAVYSESPEGAQEELQAGNYVVEKLVHHFV